MTQRTSAPTRTRSVAPGVAGAALLVMIAVGGCTQRPSASWAQLNPAIEPSSSGRAADVGILDASDPYVGEPYVATSDSDLVIR